MGFFVLFFLQKPLIHTFYSKNFCFNGPFFFLNAAFGLFFFFFQKVRKHPSHQSNETLRDQFPDGVSNVTVKCSGRKKSRRNSPGMRGVHFRYAT